MNVLLLSMPDSFEHVPAVAIRMPNGALASLAGNIDPHHRVFIADLILVQASVRATVAHLVREFEPDVVGLSVMTFQRATALKLARLIRQLRPHTRVVVGGYDPSLAPEAYATSPDVDFIVRGEGEQTFCQLLRAIESGADASAVAGLHGSQPRPVAALRTAPPRLPNRVARFEELCRAIVEAGFADVDYLVQAMTAPIAEHGARLAPLMRRAGFRYVFLGIENIVDEDLKFLRARAKNARRERGRTIGNASIEAIRHLHENGMYVVGGLIVGNPDDTRGSIETNLEFARAHVDWPYIQHPTPYPGTPMTREFQDRGLIVDEDVSHYDGTTAVVRSEHLGADDIEFLRWRAERWMKVRHFPSALVHSPGFVARHGLQMLAHTFAGSSW